MTRFLFVVPPLTGHTTPLVAVAQRLTTAGHPVVWCGDPGLVRSLAGPHADVRACPPQPFQPTVDGTDLRGYAAVRYLWEGFLVPLADASVDAVTEVARRERTEVIVADMQALAGPVAAARLGLPWATSATTSAPLQDSFTATPKVREWLDGVLGAFIGRHLGPADTLTPGELEMSPQLVVAFTTDALVGDDCAPQVRFVGPALTNRPARGPTFPWHLLDGRPLVITTVGTVNAGAGGRFLTACADAFGLLDGRVQAVIADPEGVLGEGTPPDVITHRYLPMLELLPRAAAVICHGGHNTVCESLAHGVPLIVAPIRDDQPVVAEQVVNAGAGVRLRFTRATPQIIRDAVRGVLDSPAFGNRAAEIKASFGAAGSAAEAARHLLELARAHELQSGLPTEAPPVPSLLR